MLTGLGNTKLTVVNIFYNHSHGNAKIFLTVVAYKYVMNHYKIPLQRPKTLNHKISSIQARDKNQKTQNNMKCKNTITYLEKKYSTC